MARFCPQCGTTCRMTRPSAPTAAPGFADPEGASPATFIHPLRHRRPAPWAGSPMPSRFIPNAGQGFGPRCATKKEFLMLPENKKLRSQIRGPPSSVTSAAVSPLLLMIISLEPDDAAGRGHSGGAGSGRSPGLQPGLRHPAGGLRRLQRHCWPCGQPAPSAAGLSWWPPCLRCCVPSIWKRAGRSISNTDLFHRT